MSTFFATADDAKAVPVSGWNLRCNRCGSFGANWIPNEQPGWRALALCPDDASELTEEHQRHIEALLALRAVNFEQPAPSQLRHREYDY